VSTDLRHTEDELRTTARFEGLPLDLRSPVLLEATLQLLADRDAGVEGPWWMYLENAIDLHKANVRPEEGS
jgi:hypothetical protein